MTNQTIKLISKRLIILIYIFIILSNLLIVGLSLTAPQYSLPGWQMTIGAILCALVMAGCFFIWNKLPLQNKTILHIISICLLAGFGILLFYICLTCRNSLSCQGDYEMMWKMALDLTEGNDIKNYEYLNYYSNNFKPMLFLSVIFRIASFFHISDPYYAVILISVLEVMGTVVSVAYLVDNRRQNPSCQIPVILTFALFLPLWANTQAFYTDAMSFGLIVIALALAKKGISSAPRTKYLCMLLAGLITAIGISVKITLLIPIIALCIVLLLTQNLKKALPAKLCFVFFTIIGYVLIECWACSHEAYILSKEISDPIISWIAIGLQGNGSYADNVDFVLNVHSLASKAEKTAYIKTVIAENKSNFFHITHIVDKIRTIYADGSFGAGVFSFQYHSAPNLIWNAFSPYGKYFWRTNQWCFIYIFGVYIILLVGQIKVLINAIHNKMPSILLFFADLTLLGVFLFMGIWEANNRQLYNQIPILLLGFILHLSAMQPCNTHKITND